MDFKVTSGPVSAAEAVKHADDLEKVLGEICNGQRKPGKIPMEPMIALIQFARDAAQQGKDAEDADILALMQAGDDFGDCGETDVPYATLMRLAALGLLECTHFEVTEKGLAAIAAKGGAAC